MSGRPSTTHAPRPRRPADVPTDIPVQYLKGVGPQRAAALARLGIETVADLLLHVPRRHEDRRRLTPLRELVAGREQAAAATVAAIGAHRPRGGLTVVKAALADDSGIAYAVWYNQVYLKQQLPRGTRALFYGRVDRRYGEIQFQSPEFEVVEDDEEQTWHTGRIVPVYPATETLSQRVLRALVQRALTLHAGAMPEVLPDGLRAERGLLPVGDALWALHFPQEMDQAERARKRLAFEELLTLQLGVLRRRARVAQDAKPFRYAAGHLVERFLQRLPFPLTGAQRRAIAEIQADLRAPAPMNRLLQGDVGSGKTVVAAAAMLACVQGGYQAALMAPTEILAEQHALTLGRLLDGLGLEIALVTGGRSEAGRRPAEAAARAGRAGIVIGTHALIEKRVTFDRLAFVVVDEQHKFGVMQRARLRRKGFSPDLLVMTATPIPRTLALTVYGDLDVTTLDEMPPGRRPVATHWRNAPARLKVYAFVREQVGEGRQAYVVCPLVEESEKLQAQAAVRLAEELAAGPLSGLRVGLLHGRMAGREKERVMDRLRRREIDVLVATSVVEVGIDVPNASVMVIEDADRFGLAQLHQLRGRVGRGAHRSHCILIASPGTEEGRRRMAVMQRTGDGFEIAQEDLRLRGPGEITGTRQHGLPDLRVADLTVDLPLLEEARRDAATILAGDPELRAPAYQVLRDVVDHRFLDAERRASAG